MAAWANAEETASHPASEEIYGKDGQGEGRTWGGRRKLETVQRSINFTYLKTPEALSAPPIGSRRTLEVLW